VKSLVVSEQYQQQLLLHSTKSTARPNIEASDQQSPAIHFTNEQRDPTIDDDDFQASETELLKPVKDLPIDWRRVRIQNASREQQSEIESRSFGADEICALGRHQINVIGLG
jgi:hypothetical protein